MDTQLRPRTLIPEISHETEILADFLRTKPIGMLIPYAELSALIGLDVQRAGYPRLFAAKKLLKREERIEFGVVRDKGIKRLNDSEIIDKSSTYIRRISRNANRGGQTLSCIKDRASLSPSDRTREFAFLSMFVVLREFTRLPSVRRIEAAVASAQHQLPLTETLKKFLDSLNKKASCPTAGTAEV